MPKGGERYKFSDKFNILNAQENENEINWSSSDDEVDVARKQRRVSKINNKITVSRRKRYKSLKNVSNLEISIVDDSKRGKNNISASKSPILLSKTEKKAKRNTIGFPSSSSILPIKDRKKPNSTHDVLQRSPILVPKSGVKPTKTALDNVKSGIRSPILSIKSSPITGRNIWKCVKNLQYEDRETDKTPVKKIKIEDEGIYKENYNNNSEVCDSKQNIKTKFDIVRENVALERLSEDIFEASCSNNSEMCNTEGKLKMVTDIPRSNKDKSISDERGAFEDVESFLWSHFHSQSNFPLIDESVSPKTSTESSADIASLTQTISKSSLETISNQIIAERNKKEKIKYKKGGLISRLDALLKKQQSNISVWQHERFLAENSNFVIPNVEFRMFRIRNCSIQYGCHVLDSINLHTDEHFVIVINNIYVNNTTISEDSLFKLFEPYIVINLEKYKLVVNVSKFICSTL